MAAAGSAAAPFCRARASEQRVPRPPVADRKSRAPSVRRASPDGSLEAVVGSQPLQRSAVVNSWCSRRERQALRVELEHVSPLAIFTACMPQKAASPPRAPGALNPGPQSAPAKSGGQRRITRSIAWKLGLTSDVIARCSRLSLLCSPAVGAARDTPRQPGRVSAHGKLGEIELGAEYLCTAFRATARPISCRFLVVEVALYPPKPDLDVATAHFALRITARRGRPAPSAELVAYALKYPDPSSSGSESRSARADHPRAAGDRGASPGLKLRRPRACRTRIDRHREATLRTADEAVVDAAAVGDSNIRSPAILLAYRAG